MSGYNGSDQNIPGGLVFKTRVPNGGLKSKMVLDADGRLSLGTVTPQYTLDVVGTGSFSGLLTATSGVTTGNSAKITTKCSTATRYGEINTNSDGNTMFNIISEITGNGYFFMYNSTELLRVNPTEITASKIINANAGLTIPLGQRLKLSVDGINYIENNISSSTIQYVSNTDDKTHNFWTKATGGSVSNIFTVGTGGVSTYGTGYVQGLLTANSGAYFGQNDSNFQITKITDNNRLRTRLQAYYNGANPFHLEINPLGGFVFINQTADYAYSGLPSGYSTNSLVSNDIIDMGKLYVAGTTTTTGLLTTNGGITVPSGKTLTISSGATLTIASGATSNLAIGVLTPLVLATGINFNLVAGGSTYVADFTSIGAGFYKIFVLPAVNPKNDSAYMFAFDLLGDTGYRNAVTSNPTPTSYYSINTNSLTGTKFNISTNNLGFLTNSFTISYIKMW